tara:strand:- start:13338 stop:13598 length:261 start_codon:yes stop_codon:yes gene_type:complete
MKIKLDYKLDPDKEYTVKDINLYLYAYCEEKDPEVAQKLYEPLLTLVAHAMHLGMHCDISEVLVKLPEFGREVQELREKRQRYIEK